MAGQSPTTAAIAAPARAHRVRILIATLVVGLLAPLFAVAAPANAAPSYKKHTHYEVSIQKSVLELMNKQRRAHHLKPLRMNKHLHRSARYHDQFMATRNTMSHQLRGEASLGRRVDRAGYNWGCVGENIAWNSQMSRSGVLVLQKLMYIERAPYNGHRRNILNPRYREVGVDVYMDTKHHKVWLTTDFGRKR